MNLFQLLQARAAEERPVRVALIGCGKFATMYLAQARQPHGIHIAGIADLDLVRARTNLAAAGWPDEQYQATSLGAALTSGGTWLTADADALAGAEPLDVVIEATGVARAGITHCRRAITAGHHVIMVNVEADALVGPLLAQEAAAAGVVYSLAWGDQPALICEHVDWARSCGFEVTAAGKGTRYLPEYHTLTPDTVWEVLQQYLSINDPDSINLKMFNSFLDGSKSAIEMTAVCNATGLKPQPEGLRFPPASRFELADVCKPTADGGTLAHSGTTEVVSSLTRDGKTIPHHLALGTFVVIRADNDYARRCFAEYHMLPDTSCRYAALYRPTHMIGLELGVSVASVVLRGEATGWPQAFAADVAATAKRALKAGEYLDGEGGSCVFGRQLPAAESLTANALPLGLAGSVRVVRDVAANTVLRWGDVAVDDNDEAVRARHAMVRSYYPDSTG